MKIFIKNNLPLDEIVVSMPYSEDILGGVIEYGPLYLYSRTKLSKSFYLTIINLSNAYKPLLKY